MHDIDIAIAIPIAIAEDCPAGIHRPAVGGQRRRALRDWRLSVPERRRPALPGGLAALATACAIVCALVATPVDVPGAAAAGSVSFTNSDGEATADPDYATSLTVSGSGFQSIPGGFGGIYVLFGWVDAGWQPSQGGTVGTDYRYVPDTESKDNAGFQRFVAFPGSDTEAAANAVMDAAGGWSTDFTVPGSTFNSVDRSGAVSSVDCLQVQCGLITIGAHGVKNANNETFTPISFGASGGGAGAGASGAGAGAGASGAGAGAGASGAGAGAGASGAGSAGTAGAAGAAGAGDAAASGAGAAAGAAAAAGAGASAARVGYTSSTAVAGNALSFTGQGFTPGEQVVATFDNGAAAVGPLTAGAAGEVAAVLTIPSDVRAGTHVLTLSGAASGALAESEVTVTAASGAAAGSGGGSGVGIGSGSGSAASATEAPAAWPYLLLGVAILVALALLVVSIATALVRSRRRRRAARVAGAGAVAGVAAIPVGTLATSGSATPADAAAGNGDVPGATDGNAPVTGAAAGTPADATPATGGASAADSVGQATATGTALDFGTSTDHPDPARHLDPTRHPDSVRHPDPAGATAVLGPAPGVTAASDPKTPSSAAPPAASDWTADPAAAIEASLDAPTSAASANTTDTATATTRPATATGRRSAAAASGIPPVTEKLDVAAR